MRKIKCPSIGRKVFVSNCPNGSIYKIRIGEIIERGIDEDGCWYRINIFGVSVKFRYCWAICKDKLDELDSIKNKQCDIDCFIDSTESPTETPRRFKKYYGPVV